MTERWKIHYIREPDGTIRTTEDSLEWAKWFQTANRRICLDVIPLRSLFLRILRLLFFLPTRGGYLSTVFLGIDHNFSYEGPPILFETMAFDIDIDVESRWATENEARIGHGVILQMLQAKRARGEI